MAATKDRVAGFNPVHSKQPSTSKLKFPSEGEHQNDCF